MPRKSLVRPAKKAAPTPQQDKERARREQAWRAVREVNKMMPAFRAFARALAGAKVNVHLSTDGAVFSTRSDIYITAPLALGLELRHERHLCNRRGGNYRMLCSACDQREQVVSYLFHEIAHHAGDSFAPPDKAILPVYGKFLDRWHPRGVCVHASLMIQKASKAESYAGYGKAFSGYLAHLFNILDDARVDERMFKERPGLRPMFIAKAGRIFDGSTYGEDGKNPWLEKPLDAQVIVAMLLDASNIQIGDGWVTDKARQLAADETLAAICSKAAGAKSAHQIMLLTLEAMTRLDELGLCQVPKCQPEPPTPPQPESEPDDEEQDANNSTPQESDEPASEPPPEETEQGESQAGDDAEGSDSGGSDEGDGNDAGESEPGGTGQPEPQSGDSADEDEAPSEPQSSGSAGDGSDSQDEDSADEAGEPVDEDVPPENNEDGGTPGSGDVESPGVTEPSDEDGRDEAGGGVGGEQDSAETETQPAPESSLDGESSSDTEPGEDGEDVESEGGEPEDEMDPQEGDDPTARDAPPSGEDVWDEQYNATEQEEISTGTPDDVAAALREIGGHNHGDEDTQQLTDPDYLGDDSPTDGGDDEPKSVFAELEEKRDLQAARLAAAQHAVFDESSEGLAGLEVIKYPNTRFYFPDPYAPDSEPEEFMTEQSLINKLLMKARVTFDANARGKAERNLRSGRVDGRVLGKRAPLEDERLMKRLTKPKKVSYFVAIGLDASGSTSEAMRNPRMKRSAFSMANLLSRLGIPFCIYGQTGGVDYDNANGDYSNRAWMLEIKSPDEPWNKETQARLAGFSPVAENYDGHNLEFLRKICDRSQATDRIILYYTDGEMPAANGIEELEVLTRELQHCKTRGIHIMGVGMNTDSPSRYGLETVRVDSDADVEKVVARIGEKLATRRAR